MSDITKQVDELSTLLPDIPEDVIYSIYDVIYGDFDWSFSYNETDITIGCTIGDWQVHRTIVCSMCNTIDGQRYEDGNEFDRLVDKLYDDDEQEDHDFGTDVRNDGEYLQTWLNVETGQMIVRKRTDENGRLYCDGEWQAAVETEDGVFDSVYRVDMSVHPKLIEIGYKPKTYQDCAEWGMDDVRMVLAEWQKALLHPMAKKITEVGGQPLFKKIYREEHPDYLVAAKICTRNHYVAEDNEMYVKYLENLIELRKDCHNAFYVCPSDLKSAYEKSEKQVKKQREKIRLEAERIKRMQDKVAIEEYARRAAMFAHIHLGMTNGVQVIVCPTFADMVAEGDAMHHCVGKGNYHKKDDTLILLVRDAQGGRISTVEYNIVENRIVQNRGLSNSFPRFFDEVNELITSNGDKFFQAMNGLAKAA